MWTCPKCTRKFASKNQWHECSTRDVGELFIGKPDALVLAFDSLQQEVMKWKPNDLSAAKHSVVFTSKKAWLIVKPMKEVLDLKIYHKNELNSVLIHKSTAYPNKRAYHIRIASEAEVSQQLLDLLHKGYSYSLG